MSQQDDSTCTTMHHHASRSQQRERTLTFNFGPNVVFQESVPGCGSDFVSGVSCVNKALNVLTRALPRPTDKAGPTEIKEPQKESKRIKIQDQQKDQRKRSESDQNSKHSQNFT
jgi:hypothetical protein